MQKLIDSVLPPRCPFSGKIVDSQGAVDPESWSQLSFITSPNCTLCGFPFEFAIPASAAPDQALCPSCLAHPPAFARARSALVYNDASRELVLGFKHGDQTHTVVTMVPWLRTAGADLWKEADLVVPVPLHPWRLLRRRYNQAALIGHAIAKDRKIPFLADALVRKRSTPTQGHLNAGERKKNVRKAFTVLSKRVPFIKDKTIILVDDVFTTGATVEECSKALVAAGAKQVFILTLARVVRSGRFD